jgi:putative ABC transport system substrate-binding protein
MDRRRFVLISLLGSLAVPLVAGAQQTATLYRVGYLGSFPPAEERAPVLAALIDRLKEHGYVDGRNLVLERRYSHGRDERWPDLVRELAEVRVHVVATADSAGARAVKEYAPAIPIVLLGANDPVGTGLVASLARPSGNITGLSSQLTDLEGKSLQLLREVRPTLSRIAVFWNPANAGSAAAVEALKVHASAAGVAVQAVAGRNREEMDAALMTLARERPDAVTVHLWYSASPERSRIAEFSTRNGIVSTSGSKRLVREGLLLSYSPDSAAIFRRGADYIDKILKGARAAELPIEQPTKFELVINLKTAKALGLTIPPSLMLQADEVIE